MTANKESYDAGLTGTSGLRGTSGLTSTSGLRGTSGLTSTSGLRGTSPETEEYMKESVYSADESGVAGVAGVVATQIESNESNGSADRATCIRQVANWSFMKPYHRFENPAFDPAGYLKDLKTTSPKLAKLLETIRRLDADDQRYEGRLFKHVIYSDLTHGYGAKLITSALLASGYRLYYNAKLKVQSDEHLAPFYNMGLLSSSLVYGMAFPVSLRRTLLDTFNDRPENVFGKNLRILVIDSGYKEGIDLFDVKYMHLFEPALTPADEKQVIGRATRSCGQKGLMFHPTLGWPLQVFRYEILIPPILRADFDNEMSLFFLFLKYRQLDIRRILLARQLETLTIQSAVDFPLTTNVHRFGISEAEEDIEFLKRWFKHFWKSLDPRPYPYLPIPESLDIPSVFQETSPENSQDSSQQPDIDSVDLRSSRSLRSSQSLQSSRSLRSSQSLQSSRSLRSSRSLQSSRSLRSSRSLQSSRSLRSSPSQDLHELKPQTAGKKKRRTSSMSSKSVFGFSRQKTATEESPPPPIKYMTYMELMKFINTNYARYKWPAVQMENQCMDMDALLEREAAASLQPTVADTSPKKPIVVEFTPTQNFLRHFFQPKSIYKGMLAWHSVGTGKTCMAIATATTHFEKEQYTILWVTRHTLKPDIWKNMYSQVCSIPLREKLEKGESWALPVERPYDRLTNRWLPPVSYRQFTNFLNKKNQLYQTMVKRNGAEDPLKKTLVIIDEAHKLYTTDIAVQERPDVEVLKAMLHRSYDVSKAESVRVLLMSATPYTDDPMRLIQLLNLLRPSNEALPETFEDFAKTYLDASGLFTPTGRESYQNGVAGYVSYLNREKDARQFAYPVFQSVPIPMSQHIARPWLKRIRFIQASLSTQEALLQRKRNERQRIQALLKREYETHIKTVCERPGVASKERCRDMALHIYEDKKRKFLGGIDRTLKQTEDSLERLKAALEYHLKEYKDARDTDVSQERALLDRCGFESKNPLPSIPELRGNSIRAKRTTPVVKPEASPAAQTPEPVPVQSPPQKPTQTFTQSPTQNHTQYSLLPKYSNDSTKSVLGSASANALATSSGTLSGTASANALATASKPTSDNAPAEQEPSNSRQMKIGGKKK
jgi:hypothetical protein